MTVTTTSGRRLTIPPHHPVFVPLNSCRPGDRVDPATVEVRSQRASALTRGRRFIVDNTVEVVAAVATA